MPQSTNTKIINIMVFEHDSEKLYCCKISKTLFDRIANIPSYLDAKGFKDKAITWFVIETNQGENVKIINI